MIGLGTFAKLVAPGLRVGWVIAAPAIVARLAALKADGGSSLTFATASAPTAPTVTSWAVLPSSHFHASPGPRNHVRLAYSYASPSEIVEGVRRLALAFKQIG